MQHLEMIDCEELLGTRMSRAAVVSQINKFSRDQVILFLTDLLLLLFNEDWNSNPLILDTLATELLSPKLLARYSEIQRHHADWCRKEKIEFYPRPFISPFHCFHLLRVTFCEHRGESENLIGSQDDVYDLGLAIVGCSEKVLAPASDSLSGAVEELIRHGCFLGKQKDLIAYITRFHALFFEMGTIPDFFFDNKSLAANFEKETGLALEVYFSVGFLIAAQFVQLDLKTMMQRPLVDRRELYNRPWKEFFRDSQISEKDIELAKTFYCKNLAEFKAYFDVPNQNHFDYDLVPFMMTPLVELDSKQIAVSFLPYLFGRLALGPYWILLASIHRRNSRLFGEFQNSWGLLFEAYVRKVFIENSLETEFCDDNHLFDEPYVGSKRRYKKGSDIIAYVPEQECIYLFEVTASAVTLDAWSGANNIEAFEKVRTKIITDKSKSFQRNIDDLRSGELGFAKVTNWSIKTIRPYIILLEAFPHHQILEDGVEGVIRSSKAMRRMTQVHEDWVVDDIRMIDIQDFEVLMDLNRVKRWWSILEQWNSSLILKDHTLAELLVTYDAASVRGKFVSKRYDAALKMALECVFAPEQIEQFEL